MGLKIDGIATNGALDSSGEILNVDGIDISDLIEGKGILNWEHEKSTEDTIGAIIYAKKIKSVSDCENDRQRMFWKTSGEPYVYMIAELFNEEEHPGAVAAAALIRYYHKRKEKLLAGLSIEGQTLVRKGNLLDKSVARKVALTLRPCNKACIADVFEDAKSALDKCEIDSPSYIKSYEVDSVILEDPIEEVKEALISLRKTLTAGSYNSAPSSLVGGSALQVEDRSMRNRLKAAVRDWDRIRPLKEVVKAALPELSDKYVDHFTGLAQDLMIRKNRQAPVRIDAVNSINPYADESQRELVSGLYIDPTRKRTAGPEKRHDVFELRNDSGKNITIKTPALTSAGGDTARNATNYYQLARDFFGMKDHVLPTNHFKHGGITNLYQVHEPIEGKTALEHKDYGKIFDDHKKDGRLHKLEIMDLITGVPDRHYGNIVVSKDGKLLHIDNDEAFDHPTGHSLTVYHSDLTDGPKGIRNDIVHPDTAKWLMSLNPRKLATMMAKMKVSPEKIQKSVYNLRLLQGLHGHLTFGALRDKIGGGIV